MSLIRVTRETHETPEALAQRVSSAGGLNRYGEPNFRVVWGWSRLGWIGGKWTDRDASGNVTREVIELRREPKYFPFDRWHIERWMPPEAYGSPEAWSRQTVEREDGVSIPALGPYPQRGEYEHCFTLQGPRGEFIPLSPLACEYVVRMVEHSRAARPADGKAALHRREERADKNWDSRADDIMDDATPAFHGQSFVSASA